MTEQELLERLSKMFAAELCDCFFSLRKHGELSLAILALMKQAGYVQLSRDEAICAISAQLPGGCKGCSANGRQDKAGCEAIFNSVEAKLQARLEAADA